MNDNIWAALKTRYAKQMKRWQFVMLTFAVVSCAKVRPIPEPIPSACDPETLCTELSLADWGLDSPQQVGYLELGQLQFTDHSQLVVYDVRRAVPSPVKKPDTVQRQAPLLENDYFVIAQFHKGNTNRLGGHFSAFHQKPSRGRVGLTRSPDGRRSLGFRFKKERSGFTGFWIHLFDFNADNPIYFDAREVTHLTFLVRGGQGGESFQLNVGDRMWEQKGDSLPVGQLDEFLENGRISRRWQRAWVPLDRLPQQLNRSELASLVFVADAPAKGRLFIKNLAVTRGQQIQFKSAAKVAEKRRGPVPTALWVWQTAEIVADRKKSASFIEFCRDHQITHLFLQIPRGGPRQMKKLIRRLHRIRVKVDALDGDPRYALAEHHAKVLDTVDQIITYNKTVKPKERYDGIRFDNEPYLIPGYNGVKKKEILRQYLELLEKIHAKTKRNGLTFGVDIPFWFDGRNRFGESSAALDGRPMSELIIDRVDNMAIMDYRTQAYGPDGVIAHGWHELTYAAKQKKPIWIGLETVYLPDETVFAFAAARTNQVSGARVRLDRFNGKNVRVTWIEPSSGADTTAAVTGETAWVLSEIYRAQAPAAKLTFERWKPADLRQVMDQSHAELSHFSSFFGFALHSYESLAPWLAANAD